MLQFRNGWGIDVIGGFELTKVLTPGCYLGQRTFWAGSIPEAPIVYNGLDCTAAYVSVLCKRHVKDSTADGIELVKD